MNVCYTDTVKQQLKELERTKFSLPTPARLSARAISTATSGNLRVARLIDQPRYGIDEVAVGMGLLNGNHLA